MKFLDLFRRNNKYNVKPSENVPEFVYGIPDIEKYNVCPDDNVPREVYGIPNPSKYNIEPKENIPEKVYGIKVEDRNTKTFKCKKCGCTLKKYIYGMVANDVDTSKYILGGCIIEKGNPAYHCSNCNIDYDNRLKPIIYSEKKEK